MASCLVMGATLVQAQSGTYHISGIITDSSDKQPLPFASIQISNSSMGAQSGKDGSFRISGLPEGKYTLVISYLGFETLVLPVTIRDQNVSLHLYMKPSALSLKQVTVKASGKERERNLRWFMDVFIGKGRNARYTTILNKNDLILHYDKMNATLTARCDGFLEIDNEALGYRIRYLLKDFSYQVNTGELSYWGYPLFKTMNARNSRQEKKWEKNRRITYQFSRLRFFRSLMGRQLIQQGYVLGKAVDQPFASPGMAGTVTTSYDHHIDLTIDGQKYTDSIFISAIPYDEIGGKRTDHLYELNYKGMLTVDCSNPPGMPVNFPHYSPGINTSVLSLKEPVVVNSNGWPENPLSISFRGFWADQGVAELLPFDYSPQ